jgi:hypothetical protein
MNPKCIECFHFKTIKVTDKTLKTFWFYDSGLVNKRIGEQGFVKVWFCKKEKLPRQVYTTLHHAGLLTNLNCKCRDI